MRKYEERAQSILEFDAEYHDRVGGGMYCVRVYGKFLADEDTYGLKLKIEKRLKEYDSEQKRGK